MLSCSVKFDAYRQRVNSMKIAQTSGRNAPSSLKIREVEASLQLHWQRYERLQSDLVVKLKFLDENKVNWEITSCMAYILLQLIYKTLILVDEVMFDYNLRK